MKFKQRIDIYTDGSCLINPGGPGGYAASILIDGKEFTRLTGNDPNTTSNRMEMMAVIAALESMKWPTAAVIYSDSKLVINCASGRWKRKKNLDLWKRLDAAASRHDLRWQWVKGHAGNRWNEVADWLCGQAAKQGRMQDQNDAIIAEEREWERAAWERFDQF
jgi:ribonuclease HI